MPNKRHVIYHDQRFGNLIRAVAALSSTNTVPVAKADQRAEEDRLIDRICGDVAQLLCTPKRKIDVTRALSDYDIDSMVAAELRKWVFSGSFAKDVSLFNMLESGSDDRDNGIRHFWDRVA